MLPQPGHKVVEGHEASYELLNIFDVLNLAYFDDGQNLVEVCFDAALGDDVPEELASGDLEGALLWVQLNVEPLEVVECCLEVGDEASALSGLYDDVVDIDL
jgi:hypothetical protein